MAVSGHRGLKLTAAAFGVLMVASVVSSCSSSSSSSGGGITPTATVFVQHFRYNGVPATVPSGINTFLFQNQESFPITHEMIVKALPTGDTAQDIIDSAKVPGCKGGGECETQYLAFGEIAGVDTGATLSNVFDLPAGEYFFACWETGTQSGEENGPPHASKGMVFTFTVT
jgi:hypothetical protein